MNNKEKIRETLILSRDHLSLMLFYNGISAREFSDGVEVEE